MDNLDKIAPALIKAQGAMKNVAKDCTNPFFHSKYADLTSIWDMCRGPLQANGLAVVQALKVVDGKAVMVTSLIHVSGQTITGEYPINPVKDDPQGMGSAVTYARRYALCAMLGIVADEDDDANSATQRPKVQAAPKPKPAPKVEEPIALGALDDREEYVPTVEELGEAAEPIVDTVVSNSVTPAPSSGDAVTDSQGKLFAKLAKQRGRTPEELMEEMGIRHPDKRTMIGVIGHLMANKAPADFGGGK